MFIILMIGSYVEARVSGLHYILLYFAGGTLAGLIYSFLMSGTNILIGASSSASVLLAAFLIFFKSNKIKTLVSYFFVTNKIVFIPVIIYVVGFFMLSDLRGVYKGQGNVAYGVHLLGFAFGLCYAILHNKFFPLSKFMIFPSEFKFYKSYAKTQSVDVLCQWFLKNPYNLFCLKKISQSNRASHPRIIKQINTSLELCYKDLNFYDSISIESLAHIKPSNHVESLTSIFESVENTDRVKLKMKLLFLICLSLDWQDDFWNKKYVEHQEKHFSGSSLLEKLTPSELKQERLVDRRSSYENKTAA